MARSKSMYRTTTVAEQQMGAASQLIAGIIPLDSQQSIAGYLQNIKVSVLPKEMTAGPGPMAFIVYATTDDDSLDTGEIVTAAAGLGGGTVNLSLRRNIRDLEEDPSRGDGPIYLWAMRSDNAVTSGNVQYQFVIETWGRFIQTTDRSGP